MELIATYLVTLAFAHNNIFIDLNNIWMVASKNRLKFGFGGSDGGTVGPRLHHRLECDQFTKADTRKKW